jgi:hypothetical protein
MNSLAAKATHASKNCLGLLQSTRTGKLNNITTGHAGDS